MHPLFIQEQFASLLNGFMILLTSLQQIEIIMILSILTLLSSLIGIAQGQIIASPLRMCDSPNCDITLQYKNSQYVLTVNKQYLSKQNKISFCYILRSVSFGQNGACEFNYDSSANQKYTCLLLTYDSGNLTLDVASYEADLTLSPTNNTVTSAFVSQDQTTANKLLYLAFPTANQIYEMIVGPSANLANSANNKLVFFHTFRDLVTTTYYGNLFMQRNYQCLQYYLDQTYNYNLIFYGGVLRGGVNTMHFNFLSFLSTDGNAVSTEYTLNMWGGMDYSSSHAGRDMIGYSALGYLYDLFSLYASAPFNDTSENINATFDITQTYSSYSGAMSHFVGVGGYRYYETGDLNGDEIIRKKIDYQFCFASAYSFSTTQITPLDKIIHDFTSCFAPDITVSGFYVVFQFMLLLGLLLVIF